MCVLFGGAPVCLCRPLAPWARNLPPEYWSKYGYHTARYVNEGTRTKVMRWGIFGYHAPRYQEYLETHTKMVPPAVRTVGWDVPFAGLTASLQPNGSILHGAAADAALTGMHLNQSRDDTALRNGLLMMASHRQGNAEFIAASGMYGLSAKALPFSALLLICNHAGIPSSTLLRWLSFFRPPPPMRMLISTGMNLGYFCGELHVLSASVHIWRRFPCARAQTCRVSHACGVWSYPVVSRNRTLVAAAGSYTPRAQTICLLQPVLSLCLTGS